MSVPSKKKLAPVQTPGLPLQWINLTLQRNDGHQRTCEVEAAAALQKQTLYAQLPVTSPPPVPPGERLGSRGPSAARRPTRSSKHPTEGAYLDRRLK